MQKIQSTPLRKGIISVLQTPFDDRNEVDFESLERLIENAMEAGVDGFLAPVVASEVEYLTKDERERLVTAISCTIQNRVPFIVGASSGDPNECRYFAEMAKSVGAAAYLVAVPAPLYENPSAIPKFFEEVASGIDMPLLIQDLVWNGPGLDLDTVKILRETIPTFIGLKIETVPAGPKYTAVREAFGPDFFISGGWAVPQMIEALDRGVDAMIPESSMVRVYVAIDRLHRRGERKKALDLFRQLLPILAFDNQEINISIAFFKRFLHKKGIFRFPTMRRTAFQWDEYNLRIADELIDHYLRLEERLVGVQEG
ncbi:MAG TPA: dihydrodipicolinate synthase family protein [bacterium]|nr:dihydrodipicolinate synthase family protein [bacterium]HPO07112.1 dihydrodipicolinate synthase family protein [bacterium]